MYSQIGPIIGRFTYVKDTHTFKFSIRVFLHFIDKEISTKTLSTSKYTQNSLLCLSKVHGIRSKEIIIQRLDIIMFVI